MTPPTSLTGARRPVEGEGAQLGQTSAEVGALEVIGGSGEVEVGDGLAGGGAGQIRTGLLAGLSINRAIWVLSWPILAQSFLDSLVALVDTTLAARIGVAATDAVGSAAYVMWFINVIVMSVGVGATALIARAIGGGNRSLANTTLGQAVTASLVVGAAGGALVAVAAPFAGHLFNLSPEACALMRDYLWPMAVTLPFTVLSFISIAAMRGAGDSFTPLWIMVAVNVVNLPLSWLLSGAPMHLSWIGWTEPARGPEFLNWGALGIGIGTGVARMVGAGLGIWALTQGTRGMRLHWHRLALHWETMKRLIAVGVPSFWESLGLWFGNLVVILIVGWFVVKATGEAGLVGVHMVVVRIEAFSFLPGLAMGTAGATLVGQYLGAGNPALAMRSAWICTIAACAIMGLFSYAFVAHGDVLVRWVSDQPLHHELGPRLLWLAGWVQIPMGIMMVLRSAMRGAGDTKAVMYITWLSIYAVRVPGCILAAHYFPEQGLAAIWTVMCAELVVRAALFTACFLHGGWLKARV